MRNSVAPCRQHSATQSTLHQYMAHRQLYIPCHAPIKMVMATFAAKFSLPFYSTATLPNPHVFVDVNQVALCALRAL